MMRKAHVHIILLLLTAVLIPLHGQLVTVKAEFSSDSVLLGSHFSYTLTATAGKDVELVFPQYADTISREIEVLRFLGQDTTYEEARKSITARYEVTSFSPGWNTIPPQPIGFQTPELSDTVYTTALLLTVLSPEVDTTQAFKPIKGPINTPVNLAELWPWVVGGLLLAVAVFLAVRAIRRYYRKLRNPEAIEEEHRDPPHLEAFRDLDRLRHEKLYQKGEVKEYYTRLTEIVRVYITRQFGFHALESTTQEILDAFRRQNVAEKSLEQMLEELLMLADLVKFAKEDPLVHENEKHLANAEMFVEKTYRMFRDEPSGDEVELSMQNGKNEEGGTQ